MSIKCRKCGKGAQEIGGYLHRINEKGCAGIWECRPTCDADLSFETNLMLAIAGEPNDLTSNNTEVCVSNATQV